MRKGKSRVVLGVVIIVCLGLALGFHSQARAHADTLDSPVVKDAKIALDKKDVTPLLKWVKREREIEVCEAFNKALASRNKSPQDKAIADRAFFEVLVKAYQEGQELSYTGIKPADALPNLILLEADTALDKGSSSETLEQLSAINATSAIKTRFNKVAEKRKKMNESIDAGREYVEAYVEFINYLEQLSIAIEAKKLPQKVTQESQQKK